MPLLDSTLRKEETADPRKKPHPAATAVPRSERRRALQAWHFRRALCRVAIPAAFVVLSATAAHGLGAFTLSLHRVLIAGCVAVMLAATFPFRSRTFDWRRTALGIALLSAAWLACLKLSRPVELAAVAPFLVLGVRLAVRPRPRFDRILTAAIFAAFVFGAFTIVYSRNGVVFQMAQVFATSFVSVIAGAALGLPLTEGFAVAGGWLLAAVVALAVALWNLKQLTFRRALVLIAIAVVLQIVHVGVKNAWLREGNSILGFGNTQILSMFSLSPVLFWLARSSDRPQSEQSEVPGALGRWSTIARSATVVIVPALLGVAALDIDPLLSRPNFRQNSALVMEVGFTDRKTPVFGEYGVLKTGMFGILPTCLRMSGASVSMSSEPVSPALLRDHNILIVINPQRKWRDEELRAIQAFVTDGGMLLVLGDHTDIMGTQSSLNQLVGPYGMTFNFDSGYPCRHQWNECLEIRTHPMTRGVSSWKDVSISVGATLSLESPAYPVIVGRYGIADIGNRENVQGMFLGNYGYEVGERFGDVALVAAADSGKGKVLVFGDTSPLQNTAFISAFDPFFLNIMDWANHRSLLTVPEGWTEPLGFVFWAGALASFLFVLRSTRRAGWRAAAIVIFGASFGATECAHAAVQHRRNWTAVEDRPVAWIDQSLLPEVPSGGIDPHATTGLMINLLRNGLLPMDLYDLDARSLERGEYLFVVRPTRPIGDAQVAALREFMNSGHVVVVAAGHPHRDAILPLLRSCGLDISDVPLGPVPIANRQPGGIQFVSAWPIMSTSKSGPDGSSGNAPGTLKEFVLYASNGIPIVVFSKIGDGGLLLVSDGFFFDDANLESLNAFSEGNILFLKDLFAQMRRLIDNPPPQRAGGGRRP